MFNNYIQEISNIYKSGESAELSFRTQFENMLNLFLKDELKRSDLTVIHEGKRAKFGSPDFKIIDKASNIIGYVECKDINTDIGDLIESEQIKKYLSVSNNLILTNYIDFILFKNGSIMANCSISSKIDLKSNKPKTKEIDIFKDILTKFFLTAPEITTSTKRLSEELAKRTRILRDFIFDELQTDDTKSQFSKVYEVFKKAIIQDLSKELFTDIYSQIMSFGLLFFRLSKDIILTKENIINNIPHYIPLLKDIFHNTRFDKWESNILWIIDEILLLLNNIDTKIIKDSLSYKELSLLKKREKNLADPFLYFYEEFLKVYDKKTKVSRGVFYTPESVVSFIIRSLDVILKEKLDIKKGFLDQSIKVLDFATGTGTFILALIEFIKTELWRTNNQGLFNTEVNEFILENIYGFELLAVPYIICHLRIHEYLESFGFHYQGDKKERAEIYLTNTLENHTNILLTNFFDDIDEEAGLAHKVKNDEDILVIMGNPPYSVSSSNKTEFIENIMKSYKEAVREERNIQPLSDDYIKFVRFAHWKMEKVKKGVIGVITNNSFIDGIIHRGMREELTKTFDEIYILNLHGNSNIGETCPDGSKDENVFDIKQGVCISFFIKTGKKKNENAGVYYYSLQSLRDEKYSFLYEKLINNVEWNKLNAESPNFWFKKKDLSLESEYNEFLKITEIFREFSSGVKTHRDHFVVGFSEKELINNFNDFRKNDIETILKTMDLHNTRDWNIEEAKKNTENIKINDFIHNYSYRPFDIRKVIYNLDLLEKGTNRFNIMKNFINKNNIGLIIRRTAENTNSWQQIFISNVIIDINYLSAQSYFLPLYLYPDTNSFSQDKIPNFTNDFNTFIKQKGLDNKTPEDILGYIYAILYSPTYRTKYYEFLKIDFPRIPFTEDTSLFDKLSLIGQKLIDLHLLKVDFDTNIVNFPVSKPDLTVTKVEYKNNQVWFNDTTYFDNIPKDIWDYQIGGYQVLDKWLKERKKHNYILNGTDLQHFIKVCNVLAETIKIQKEIDDLTKEWI